MALYGDGWVGAAALLSVAGPNGNVREPDPFGTAFVRSYSGDVLTDFLQRHLTAPTASVSPPALAITACEINSWDPRTVWVAFNQEVQVGSGREVQGDGSLLFWRPGIQINSALLQPIAGITRPRPWILRLRLSQPLQEVRNTPGTLTALPADTLECWFPPATLVGARGTPNPAPLHLVATRYPIWTLVQPKWHAGLTTGSPLAPLWSVLYSAYGRFTSPPHSTSLATLYQFPLTGPSIGSSPAFWEAMVAPNVANPSGRASRVVLEANEDAAPFTATLALGSERIYGVPVIRHISFSGAAMVAQQAAQMVLAGDAPDRWSTTNGRIPVEGVEDCTGGGGTVTTVAKAIARVYGGNFPRTGGTDEIPTYPRFKPFITALTRDAKGLPQNPASPVDWAKLDLPGNFKHGDPIPYRAAPWLPLVPDPTLLTYPTGIGYARLLRGSPPVGNRKWDADVETLPDLKLIPPRFIGFRTFAGLPTKGYLYFDRPIVAAHAALIHISQSVTVPSDYTFLPSQCCVVITWSAPLTVPEATALSVVVDAGAVTATASSGPTAVLSVAGGGPVTHSASLPQGPGRVATPLYCSCNPTWGLQGVLLTRIRIYYDMPLEGGVATGVGLPTIAGTASVVTSGIGREAGYLELTLAPGITDAEAQATLSVTVPAGYVKAKAAAPDLPIGTSTGGTFPLYIIQPRNCYVLICNRYTGRDYTAGDLVTITGETSQLLESEISSTVEARTLYDTSALETGMQGPHRHLTEGGGPLGGGPAFATPMPLGFTNSLELLQFYNAS